MISTVFALLASFAIVTLYANSPLFGLQSAALRLVAVACYASSAGQKAVSAHAKCV